jgi:hypothetical protein
MTFSRRRFPFVLGAATFCFSNAGAMAQVSGEASEQVNAPNGGRYFFQNETFENIFLTSLGRAYHSGGDVGRVLYLTRQSRMETLKAHTERSNKLEMRPAP